MAAKFHQWFEEIYRELTGEPLTACITAIFADKKAWRKIPTVPQADHDAISWLWKIKNVLFIVRIIRCDLFSLILPCVRVGIIKRVNCALNDTASELKKRQEIGRGLRLPVNQQGVRLQDKSKNILTVIANESYEEFASKPGEKSKKIRRRGFCEKAAQKSTRSQSDAVIVKILANILLPSDLGAN